MELKDMEKLLGEAFKIWNQPGRLGNHSLCQVFEISIEKKRRELGLSSGTIGRAKALQEVIRSGINTLGIEGDTPPKVKDDPKWGDINWRSHNILTLSTEPNISNDKIAEKIGLAKGGRFFEEKNNAFNQLASILQREVQPSLDYIDSEPPVGALRVDDNRYIQRKPDMDLVWNPDGLGRTCVIRGPWQVGKTSLLYRAINQLERRGAKAVQIDFQNIDLYHLKSLDTLLYQLAESIRHEFKINKANLEKAWQDLGLAAKLKITRFLEDYVFSITDAPIVFALDEVDLLYLTDFREDFFSMLRSWHNKRALSAQWDKLSILLIISTQPHLLIKDRNQSPFNVGLTFYLDDFNNEQVNDLNQIYGFPLPEDNLSNLMTLLNGHPYLTNLALFILRRDKMDWSNFEALASSSTGPFATHLQHQYHHLVRQPELINAFKDIVDRGQCSDEVAEFRLLKAGLIKYEDNHFNSRCDLYRQYFSKYW